MTRINAEKRYETIITASPTYCASLTFVSGESYLVRLTISATPTATRPKDIGLIGVLIDLSCQYQGLQLQDLLKTNIFLCFHAKNIFSAF